MRYAFALLLGLHGIAHLVGFLVPWGLVESENDGTRTTLMEGTIEVSATSIRMVAILWIPLALAFLAAATGLVAGAAWWYSATVFTAAASLVFCVIHLPEARIGLYVNGFILIYVTLSRIVAWVPDVLG